MCKEGTKQLPKLHAQQCHNCNGTAPPNCNRNGTTPATTIPPNCNRKAPHHTTIAWCATTQTALQWGCNCNCNACVPQLQWCLHATALPQSTTPHTKMFHNRNSNSNRNQNGAQLTHQNHHNCNTATKNAATQRSATLHQTTASTTPHCNCNGTSTAPPQGPSKEKKVRANRSTTGVLFFDAVA